MSTTARAHCPDWRRSWSGQLKCGSIRSLPEDFFVAEILDFEFSADGEHDFLLIEKTGANTAWVARQLAGFANVAERDVGYAGMKDRHAVTRQWFSVRRPSGAKAQWDRLEIEGVSVNRYERHRRKLKKGAHRGNRFEIKVRDTSAPNDVQSEWLDRVSETGVPNYFGEQRFGHAGANLQLVADLFKGRRLSRAKRGLALSTARAFLFNHVLEHRIADGSWNQLIPGDCANLHGSGSVFHVPDVDATLRQRCMEQDIHPTGPLWGQGEVASSSTIAALEKSVAARFAEISSGLELHTDQARRALRLAVHNFEWQFDDGDLHLKFELNRGGFATAVLREIVYYEDGSRLFTKG